MKFQICILTGIFFVSVAYADGVNEDTTSCLQPNNFRCKDSTCIFLNATCNKIRDCPDGSDEESCESKECEPGHFQCNGQCISKNNSSNENNCEHKPIDWTNCTTRYGKYACKDKSECIDIRQTCNNRKDCSDGSDEEGACERTNNHECSKCSHECKSTPNGPVCLCAKGFMFKSDNTCTDINECETFGICDQICTNIPGSYTCSCGRNYVLQEDRRSCIFEGSDKSLIYSVRDQIKGVSLKSGRSSVIIQNIPNPVAVAPANDDVYWMIFERGLQAIKANDYGYEEKTVITNGVHKPGGLAVDWMTGNVYFTDQYFKYIVVCSSDGYECAVLHNNSIVDKPGAIALSTEHGLMFWTDWGKKPFVGCSRMDGSTFMNLVSSNIIWPSDLTVDSPSERIYWVDAKHQKIETIRFDQSDRRVILADLSYHPFSIVVFENKLYWNDKEDIFFCNKFTGKDIYRVIHESNKRIYNLHLPYHVLQQKDMNKPCEKHHCNELCVLGLASNGLKSTCLSSKNEKMFFDDATHNLPPVIVAGGLDSLYVIEHKTLGRPKIKTSTFKDIFITALTYNPNTNTVLFKDKKNNYIYSYNLQTREAPVPVIEYGLGPISSMEYDNYGNNLYWCDENKLTVEAYSFTTFSRTIIISGNNSETPHSIALVPDQGFIFVAVRVMGSGKLHIDRLTMNGDLSSRKRLVEVNSASLEVELHYSRTLQKLFWFDSDTSILQSIKVNVSDKLQVLYGVSAYTLTSIGSTIFWTNNTSNIEWFNFETDVGSNMKLNTNSKIINYKMKLTSVSSPVTNNTPCMLNNGGCSHLCLVSFESESKKVCACPSGYSLSVDQLTCVKPKNCLINEFQCYTGECIPNHDVCNTKKDCIHGEDELVENCGLGCPGSQFFCHDHKQCVDRNKRCDGNKDCNDGSDEICDTNCTTAGKFWCDSGKCIENQLRCDGKVDCIRGYDELNCAGRKCPTNEFRCSSGQCIPREWECDSEPDCIDGSDELKNCDRRNCSSNEFLCTNGRCIDGGLRCDGHDDCSDYSDELHCVKTTINGINRNDHVYDKCNPLTHFLCSSNEHSCLPNSARCNGIKECRNGEDEEHCNTNPCNIKRDFYCVMNHLCIPLEWVCDKEKDCTDGADEKKSACLIKPLIRNKSSEKYLSNLSIYKPCTGFQFQCANGDCVLLSKVCNSVADCKDSSDENGKCNISCSNFGCSQKCFKTPSGPKCECHLGYYLDSDNKTCKEENECNMNICAQNCTKTPGSYMCSCFSSEYMLRSDEVSCKAKGPSAVFVTASENRLTLISRNLKHTSGLTFGSLAFNSIVALDVDVHRNYVFVLLKDNILQRIKSTSHLHTVEKILPGITSFTVDWISDNVYYTDGRKIRITSLNRSLEHIDVELYQTSDEFYVSTLAVDPVIGYVFWFQSNIISSETNNSIMRMEGLGENVTSIASLFMYGIDKLVIDSFARHLYWFDSVALSICRMNYDGSKREVVIRMKEDVITFAVFESSVYWSSSAKMTPIQKCRTYGQQPRKCQLLKLNSHGTRHLAILQKNAQRLGPNPAGNLSKTLCASSPQGPRCISCSEEIKGKRMCTSYKWHFHLSSGQNYSNLSFTTLFAILFIFCLISGLGVMTYWHYCKPKSEILHRLYFHNPIYNIPGSFPSDKTFKEPLLNSSEISYENALDDIHHPTSNSNNNNNNNNSSKSLNEKKMKVFLQTLQEEPDFDYVTNSSKQPLIEN